jgi:hypothetical protein
MTLAGRLRDPDIQPPLCILLVFLLSGYQPMGRQTMEAAI